MSDYTAPLNPIAAVTHADPYPYYERLVREKPLYFDPGLKCWVASSAEKVRAVLESQLCRVRPPDEPVPTAILDKPPAEIFRRLARMIDGEAHHTLKRAISATFAALDPQEVERQAGRWARALSAEIQQDLNEYAFHLPVWTLASLLGVPEDHLEQTTRWVHEYIACLLAVSSREQIEQGGYAVSGLFELIRALRTSQTGLLGRFVGEAHAAGCEDEKVQIANAIGFLSQAYEATAGLIGNAVLVLAAQSQVREEVLGKPNHLGPFLEEVLRYDSPVQNTRRYLAENGWVAGQEMRKGDCVLVVLAAANRDPEGNPDPDCFRLLRANRRLFTFGLGAHACPGDRLAMSIARAGLSEILAAGLDWNRSGAGPVYQSSANVRIPLFKNKSKENSDDRRDF